MTYFKYNPYTQKVLGIYKSKNGQRLTSNLAIAIEFDTVEEHPRYQSIEMPEDIEEQMRLAKRLGLTFKPWYTHSPKPKRCTVPTPLRALNLNREEYSAKNLTRILNISLSTVSRLARTLPSSDTIARPVGRAMVFNKQHIHEFFHAIANERYFPGSQARYKEWKLLTEEV